MEVGRLLTALYVLWTDFSEFELVKKLTALVTASQNLSASPSDPATSEAFSKAADTLKVALTNAQTNDAPGSVRQALLEADLDSILPKTILARVTEILQASPFLLPQASASLQSLLKDVKNKHDGLNNAIVGLENLNFKADSGAANTYEIGVLMPSEITKDDLRVIEREFHEWVFVINHIQELVSGQPDSKIPVHSMSTGSLDLYCGFHANGAEAMTILTLGAYAILQYVRDAQRRRKEMDDLKYPRDVIDLMLKHENDLIEAGKTETVEKLMTKATKKLCAGRENELRTALKRSVTFVLRRLNEGVDVEVTTPPEAEGEVEAAKEEVKQLRSSIETMRLEMSKITASLPDRKTPMLQLPEPEDGDTPATKSEAISKHGTAKKGKN